MPTKKGRVIFSAVKTTALPSKGAFILRGQGCLWKPEITHWSFKGLDSLPNTAIAIQFLTGGSNIEWLRVTDGNCVDPGTIGRKQGRVAGEIEEGSPLGRRQSATRWLIDGSMLKLVDYRQEGTQGTHATRNPQSMVLGLKASRG